MKNHRQISACLVSLALFAGCSSAPRLPDGTPRPGSHEVVSLIGSSKVHRYTLDNGLRLLVVEDHSSPTFAYQTWVRVGSRDEVRGRTGLAHLFEHMMFKGTTKHPNGEFERTLDAAGAEGTNAYTTRDYTVYVQELPVASRQGKEKDPKAIDSLDLIMSLESDRMVNLIVNDQSFKTEVEVVQNERRMRYENNPDGMLYHTLWETAFTTHTYRTPVIGLAEDLAAMSSEDARAFYKSYYSPNHATIIVSGDVDPDEVHEKARKHFGLLPRAESPVRVIDAEPPQTAPRRKALKLPQQTEKLFIAYHIPSVMHEDIPALGMLSMVLGSGRTSRLYRALVETGIATDVGVDQMDDKDPSLFLVSATLQKGKRAAVAESVILKEIARISRDPVSSAELERAKNRMSFWFVAGLDSNNEKAHYLGHYETVAGDFQHGLRLYKSTLAATPEQIQAAAAKYLDARNRTTVTGAPK
ncbi:MAG TPA: pitrilysin family protein [Bdellovibrionota bacterium]|nr:pitrilysin family protein [Bdellovibrionota bacterium]